MCISWSQVRICGLEIMNDDPSAADVVYAKLHDGGTARDLSLAVDDGIVENASTVLTVVRRAALALRQATR